MDRQLYAVIAAFWRSGMCESHAWLSRRREMSMMVSVVKYDVSHSHASGQRSRERGMMEPLRCQQSTNAGKHTPRMVSETGPRCQWTANTDNHLAWCQRQGHAVSRAPLPIITSHGVRGRATLSAEHQYR